MLGVVFFFFFKQKTAYEMRISDWSSDVCSSDLKAIGTGAFEREVVGIEVKTRKGVETVSIDEQPGKAQPEKIPTLKPAFVKDGTITAANASSISDGAEIGRASCRERVCQYV